MAATADPRAKPPPAHHLEPWARQPQQPPRAHRVRAPAHQTVEESSSSVGASAARDRRRSSSNSSRRSSGCGGSEDLRGKLVGHLRDAADRPRLPQPTPSPPPPTPKAASPQPPETEREPSQELKAPPQEQEQPQQEDVAEKPWKLRERTRRRPAALTSWPAASPSPSRRRKRAPFSVSLAPEEIEEDIYALTGGRPRRRPRKRPRAVQQKLDSLFPGMWLAEVTADDYKVPEPEEE
ncbi:serine/arginine repetitive matrix protein 1-like [Lolium rigidum]|uniref:serine/arginine repetitive matrix protein 1-like n=1 Tax=Lolium rigidum TaxID=89674 RepID=UPI001F5DABA6|nr:serine/arginine repetitive matrix protein 1-like [Lolium rigidum]